MKTRFTRFTFTIALGLLSLGFQAQTTDSPTDVHFNIEPLNMKAVSDFTQMNNLLLYCDSFKLAISMVLSDTANINKINIQVGATEGADDVINKTFSYGDTQPGGSYTYSIYGKTLVLGLGVYADIKELCGQVIIEDHSGNSSAPVHVHPFTN